MADNNDALVVSDPQSIKDRLQASFDVVMVEANIPVTLQKVVSAFFTNFMRNTDEARLEEMLLTMRDQLIPFILSGEEIAPTVEAQSEPQEVIEAGGTVLNK